MHGFMLLAHRLCGLHQYAVYTGWWKRTRPSTASRVPGRHGLAPGQRAALPFTRQSAMAKLHASGTLRSQRGEAEIQGGRTPRRAKPRHQHAGTANACSRVGIRRVEADAAEGRRRPRCRCADQASCGGGCLVVIHSTVASSSLTLTSRCPSAVVSAAAAPYRCGRSLAPYPSFTLASSGSKACCGSTPPTFPASISCCGSRPARLAHSRASKFNAARAEQHRPGGSPHHSGTDLQQCARPVQRTQLGRPGAWGRESPQPGILGVRSARL